MISLCPVLVSTPQGRSLSIAPSRSQDPLSRKASKPSSTAAKATSAPASGWPPCVTLTRATAFSRMRYCGLSVVTLTWSVCSARPTCSAATPSLKAGLARSTIAVGAWYSLPWVTLRHQVRAQSSGSRQPQVKSEYHGTSRMRPRSTSTLT